MKVLTTQILASEIMSKLKEQWTVLTLSLNTKLQTKESFK